MLDLVITTFIMSLFVGWVDVSNDFTLDIVFTSLVTLSIETKYIITSPWWHENLLEANLMISFPDFHKLCEDGIQTS